MLHAHLVDAHGETVRIDRGARPSYEVRCPLCGEHYRQAIKRGRADRSFLEVFEHDVRVVGADILLQHLIGQHPEAMGVDPSLLTEDEVTGDAGDQTN